MIVFQPERVILWLLNWCSLFYLLRITHGGRDYSRGYPTYSNLSGKVEAPLQNKCQPSQGKFIASHENIKANGILYFNTLGLHKLVISSPLDNCSSSRYVRVYLKLECCFHLISYFLTSSYHYLLECCITMHHNI